MFVRASLIRSWCPAPNLVRESTEAAKCRSNVRVRAGEKTAKQRFEPLREHPEFEVPLDEYELFKSYKDPNAESEDDSDSDSDSDDAVEEEEEKKEEEEVEELSAYQRFQRRNPRPKKQVKRVTKLTLNDIPLTIRQLMWKRAKKLPVQIIVGNKGVTKGLLISLRNHFARHDVVKVSVCQRWAGYARDVAQELEERSGGLVIHDGGRRMLVFRGYEEYPVPAKTHSTVKQWWKDFKSEEEEKQAEQESEGDE